MAIHIWSIYSLNSVIFISYVKIPAGMYNYVQLRMCASLTWQRKASAVSGVQSTHKLKPTRTNKNQQEPLVVFTSLMVCFHINIINEHVQTDLSEYSYSQATPLNGQSSLTHLMSFSLLNMFFCDSSDSNFGLLSNCSTRNLKH